MSDGLGTVVEAARLGAAWALEALYVELHPALLSYLHHQEPQDAEDLASETWIDLARALPRFEGDEGGLRRLLFTIARRRMTDLRRARSRRQTWPSDPEALSCWRAPDDPAGTTVENLSSEAALARMAAVLTPEQAEVVALRVVAGLDTETVAELVGKRPGAVRVLQHRALGRLAESMAEGCNAARSPSDVDG